jgi:hypothetical protein
MRYRSLKDFAVVLEERELGGCRSRIDDEYLESVILLSHDDHFFPVFVKNGGFIL